MNDKSTDIRLSFFFTMLFLFSLLHISPERTSDISEHTTAYLDPGTGTMVISAIIGIFATIALGIKTFWYKIIRIFKPSSENAEVEKE